MSKIPRIREICVDASHRTGAGCQKHKTIFGNKNSRRVFLFQIQVLEKSKPALFHYRQIERSELTRELQVSEN